MSPVRFARDGRVARADGVLLRAVADGDLAAHGELYDRHARAMWRIVERNLGARSDAEDVVHTVFLKLPKIARSYDGRVDARSWLIGIAVRVSLRHRRSVGRFLRMLSWHSLGGAEQSVSTPEASASRRQELTQFEMAFAALSPKKRAVFALIEIEGFTAEEASCALGVPAATIRTRLHHARRQLHGAIARRRGA